jgi:hypothetical protein
MTLVPTRLCNKIRLVAFVISNILGCSNLCHLSCDFNDYALEKNNDFYYNNHEI